MRRWTASLFCLLVLLFVVPPNAILRAQGGTAQINGTVSDQTGAVLPGVVVTATQTDTGISRSAVSNETGFYVLPNLPVGPYRLDATLQGFQTFAQTGIQLQINSAVSVNPVLNLGDVEETVEVQADAVTVDTRATGIGEVIDNQRILELPLVGRQVQDLVTLSGAAVLAATTNAGSRAIPGVANFSIAGGLNRGTSFTLDGASHNDFRGNMGLAMPFPDALQEFKVETSAVPAQYGFRSGGAVNAVTKSGTNVFHGTGFWFLRDEAFNARNFFSDKGDGLKRHQFGGTIGGPVRQNRLFFFAGYQGTEDTVTGGQLNRSEVPTAAMLRGDFSVYNSTACRARPVALPAPFVNNVAPASAFSPAALAAARSLPVPDDECGTTFWAVPNEQSEKQLIGRIDYQVNNSHSLFGRYMGYPWDLASPFEINPDNILLSGQRGLDNLFQSGTIGDTITIGPNIVNSFRFGWNRTHIQRIQPVFFDVTDLGINATPGVEDMIFFAVSGAFNISGRTAAPNSYRENTLQWSNDLGMVLGNHQLNIGGLWMFGRTDHESYGNSVGLFRFNGAVTGLPMADFLLGRSNSWEQGATNFTYGRSKVAGIYLQDSWQTRPNLTLSLGVRWEPNIVPEYVPNQSNYFDFEAFRRGERTPQYRNAPAGMFYPGDSQFPKGGNPTMAIANEWNRWAPRLGVVWDPFADGRTVIRSAYGLFYETQAIEFWSGIGDAAPWAGLSLTPNVLLDDPWRNVPSGNPFPYQPGPNVVYPAQGAFAIPLPGTKPPRVHQWNLGIQRQVAGDVLVSASYIGNHVANVYGARELNPGIFFPGVSNAAGLCTATVMGQPVSLNRGGPNLPCSVTANLADRRITSLLDPEGSRGGRLIGTMETWDDRGTRDYNGLLLSATKRSAAFSVSGNYTWSHCLSHPINNNIHSNPGGGVYNDPSNPGRDRGNCDEDRRHIANSTLVVSTPTFANPVMNRVLGDWRVSGIFRAQSGQWLTPLINGDSALNGSNPGEQRADVLSSDFYGNKCTHDLRSSNPTCRWVNAAAFGIPAPGTLGTAGRGIVLGPGYWTIDAGLTRSFNITDGRTLEFRVEATNVLNHLNLGNPNMTVGNALFGLITSAGSPRIMQFALKYLF